MAQREDFNLQERYSELIDAKFDAVIVTQDGVVFNNDYEGKPTAGAVKVAKINDANVRAYDKSTGLTPEEVKSEWVTMTIEQDDAVSEIIDGYEAASVPYSLQAKRLDRSAVAMAQNVDTKGLKVLVAGGTTETSDALTKDTIYNAIVDLGTKLDEANIPDDGRYIIVSPKTYALLLKSPEFIKASALGDAVVQNGTVGRVDNFLVKKSTKLGNSSIVELKDVEIIAGHPACATRAKEWSVPVSLHNAGTPYIGASVIDGRQVFDHKVTYNKGVLIKKKTA